MKNSIDIQNTTNTGNEVLADVNSRFSFFWKHLKSGKDGYGRRYALFCSKCKKKLVDADYGNLAGRRYMIDSFNKAALEHQSNGC